MEKTYKNLESENITNKEKDIIPDFKDIKSNLSQSINMEKSPEEAKKIEENSPFSKEINDCIRTKEELDIYKNVPLKEGEVNGKPTLERTDIDHNQIDEDTGKTNLELMKEGKAPLDKDGNPIELHHIGQKSDSPLAELTKEEHRGKNNHTTLHDLKKESEIYRDKFNEERREYWQARAKQIEG